MIFKMKKSLFAFLSFTLVVSIAVIAMFEGLTNEYGGQIGENESLDKGHQDLNAIDKHCQGNEHRAGSVTQRSIHGSKYEDEDNKAENNNVAGNHVRKKTNHECERLGHNTHQFHRHHDKLDRNRYTREPEDVTPEMLVGAEKDYNE
jgi:hypothetical protein